MKRTVRWTIRYSLLLIVIILVLAPVGAFRISPPLVDKYATLGSKLWWTCSAIDTAPSSQVSIQWKFGSAVLSSDSRRTIFSNGTMYIPVVQRDHLGEYTCVATDSQTVAESKAWLR
ncbi:hypothetical protein EGW08_002584, partial [Elysia chlorotica]